jgi:hypothetical protein
MKGWNLFWWEQGHEDPSLPIPPCDLRLMAFIPFCPDLTISRFIILLKMPSTR